MEREMALADLQVAVLEAAALFKDNPTHENLVSLNEAREALRTFTLNMGTLDWTPTQH